MVGPSLLERLALTHFSRLLRFCLVGGSGVVVNMGVLALLVSVGGWQPFFAAPIAAEVAILNNFLLNDRWAFRDKRSGRSLLQRGLRYNGLTLGGVLISIAMLTTLVYFFRVHYVVANLFAIGAGTAWNYSMNTWLTWVNPAIMKSEPAGALTG
jgi:dolichol-phosphate mannosyltransferase